MNPSRTAPSPGVLVNLRDIADLPAPDDGLLRRGVLWRSEAPQPDDAAPLDAAPWPPGTVIDLRDAAERRGRPHPMTDAGIEIVDLPLAGTLAPSEQTRLRAGALTLADLYLRLLDRCQAWLPRLVHVAATAPAPILVHCAAGKDRTGVTTAMLLRLAEAPVDAVMADYLATADVLDDLLPRLHLVDQDGRPVPRHLVGLSEDGMRAVLDAVGDDPASFHREHGVADADIRRWCDRILAG